MSPGRRLQMNPADAFITTDSYCSAPHSNNSRAWGSVCKWLFWNRAGNLVRMRNRNIAWALPTCSGFAMHYQIWLLTIVPFYNELTLSMKKFKIHFKLKWEINCCCANIFFAGYCFLIFYNFVFSLTTEFVLHILFYISDKNHSRMRDFKSIKKL